MQGLVEIDRKEASVEGTLGVVCVNKQIFCISLEPWMDKRIRPGMYEAVRYYSPHFQLDTFMLKDIPNRTYIEIHPGNLVQDTQGCIILGQYPGKLRGDRAVLNSGNTFKRFMEIFDGLNSITVIIREVF